MKVNNAGVAKEKSTTAFSAAGEPNYESTESISEHLLKSTHDSWVCILAWTVYAALADRRRSDV
jgi:hypothetical protein